MKRGFGVQEKGKKVPEEASLDSVSAPKSEGAIGLLREPLS